MPFKSLAREEGRREREGGWLSGYWGGKGPRDAACCKRSWIYVKKAKTATKGIQGILKQET